MTSGKTADTTIRQITEAHGRGSTHVGYYIRYRFLNENTGRIVNGRTRITLAEADDYTVGQEIRAEYIGGKLFSSRIKGSASWFWPSVFFLMLVALVASIGVFCIQMHGRTSKR